MGGLRVVFENGGQQLTTRHLLGPKANVECNQQGSGLNDSGNVNLHLNSDLHFHGFHQFSVVAQACKTTVIPMAVLGCYREPKTIRLPEQLSSVRKALAACTAAGQLQWEAMRAGSLFRQRS